MKLISLNTWGGRIPKIIPFLEEKKMTTDFFCFQEVYNNAPESELEIPEERRNFFEELKMIFSDFEGYFTPQLNGAGQAMFIRKGISVDRFDSSIILSAKDVNYQKTPYGDDFYPRIIQSLSLKKPKLTIYNFHGIPGEEKKDTPARKLQLERVLDFMSKDSNLKIIAGDFNLNPDTEMVSTLEKIMQNPLKGSSFKTTRSSLYAKRSAMPFADYAFISNEIKIVDFQVLPDEMSDHLALELKFDISTP